MHTEYLTTESSYDRSPDSRSIISGQITKADERTCKGCDAHVTKQFQRVMGDNNDHVYACPSCADNTELMRGKAAGVTA